MELSLERKLLSGLLALALLVVAVAAYAPQAKADQSDCPGQTVCLWSGYTYGGSRAFFAASETGCHGLGAINPQSLYNNTSNRRVTWPVAVGPGGTYQWLSPWSGYVCFE
jgi:Peptidase inhibitor family I36